MKRTYLAVLLAGLLCMGLAGCGKNVTEDSKNPETTTIASESDTNDTTDTDVTSDTIAQETAFMTDTTASQDTSETAASETTGASPAATTQAANAAPSGGNTVRTTQAPATQAPAPAATQAPAPAATQAPAPATEPQTQPLTPEEQPIVPPAGWTWYVGEAAFEDGYFKIPVKVKDDPGIYGYNMNLSINGMSITEAGFELLDVEQGDAYGFDTFMTNAEKGNIAGTEMTQKSNRVAGQDTTVAYYYLSPPAGAQSGTSYTVTITGLSVGNYGGQNFNETNGIHLGSTTITIP